ncbi:hypothetical protein SLEP1_g50850 [Rubroshorea leprosula]|uniref:Uncharacterized protein n=1 Tax=Rubroshorea leprosula TaxID=152421 RepID=A0AAV5M4U6_9ROSI|nr:hypothetical protein SLEP1_g50850 [Rubroshorea leprosula]
MVRPSETVDCAKNYVFITQDQEGTEPNGIPIYAVEITNECPTGCKVSRLHIDCGEFASDILINPNTFKRINIGDCLVNDGEPLEAGAVISFKYATTFKIPMSRTWKGKNGSFVICKGVRFVIVTVTAFVSARMNNFAFNFFNMHTLGSSGGAKRRYTKCLEVLC